MPLAWRPVGAVAGLVAALLLATNGGYGYHRDELYFLMLRPAWGYRDQPPLTPALGAAGRRAVRGLGLGRTAAGDALRRGGAAAGRAPRP